MKAAASLLPAVFAAVFVTSCHQGPQSWMVGPDYSRPDVAEPSRFRFGSKKGGRSLGELDWRSVYRDSAMQSLIQDGLDHNPDMAAAAARVLQAQASLDIAHSNFFPALGLSYNFDKSRLENPGAVPALVANSESHNLGVGLMAYEFDFWGKIRRANQAARARLVATEEGRRLVQMGLISSIARAYVTLREQDYELSIARSTRDSRSQSLGLLQKRQEGGQSPLTDVRQGEVLIAEADAAIGAAEKQIGLLENQISYLTGRPPGSIRRGSGLYSNSIVTTTPAGLPSELLNRRPDIRGSEQALIAATADIGVAKAQLLPSFTLTGSAGLTSLKFHELFEHPARIWSIGPGVSVPVFAGGRLLANLRGSKAARDEAEAEYRKTVLQSLREVSDALISREKSIGIREAQGRIVKARKDSLGLMRERYDNGASAYLEVLYNDQQLFSAQLAEARARMDELLAMIELYRALGGGWDARSAPPSYPPAK